MSWFISCAKAAASEENQQVDLVGEAPAEFVAEKSGDERADRHADEGQRDELQVLRQSREFGLNQRREDTTGHIEVVAVEKHAGADEPEDAVMKRTDGQTIETRARIDRRSHARPPRAPNVYWRLLFRKPSIAGPQPGDP
jgi:hypothetical protein